MINLKLVSLITLASLLGSCSTLTPKQISKNCDELAVKFLKASHSQASVNGGQFAKEVLTVNNATTIITANGNKWKIGTIKRHTISPSGKVATFKKREFFIAVNGDSPEHLDTSPTVITGDQIACQYRKLWAFSTKNDIPPSSFQIIAYLTEAGEELTVTEDKNYIRWE